MKMSVITDSLLLNSSASAVVESPLPSPSAELSSSTSWTQLFRKVNIYIQIKQQQRLHRSQANTHTRTLWVFSLSTSH